MAGLIDVGRGYVQQSQATLGDLSRIEESRERTGDAIRDAERASKTSLAATGAGIGLAAGMGSAAMGAQFGVMAGPVGMALGTAAGLVLGEIA